MTVIANYLATTLPEQMTANDVNHSFQVENELGHFQAVLRAVSDASAVGGQVVQPVTLGSEGVPPFAGPDGANVESTQHQPNASVVLSLLSTHYAPPTGWVAGGIAPPSCGSYPNFSCLGGSNVTYNFTNSGGIISFRVHGAGGNALFLNFSANSSLILVDVPGQGGGYEHVMVVGSHNSVFVNGTGNMAQDVTIVGNWNNLTMKITAGAAFAPVLVVGNHDTVTYVNTPGSSANVVASFWGKNDTFNAGSGGFYNVYFTGFDAENPTSPICPYFNPSTFGDNVTGPKNVHGKNYTVTYNGTNLSGKTEQFSPWHTIYNTPAPSACIFFPQFRAEGSNVVAASFVVHLLNSYAPRSEVAFDQGAVIRAQPGGYPVMVDAPPVSFSAGIANVWLPAFLNTVGSESGTGTAVMSLHLFSVGVFNFPAGGWLANPGHNFGNATQPILGSIQLNYTTPYAYAWNNSAWASSIRAAGGTVHCGNIIGAPDPGLCGPTPSPYESGGPLGLITITLPAVRIVLTMAVFSIALQ